MSITIGVDVGGTNTDAVALQKGEVLSWSKKSTSADVTSGVTEAIKVNAVVQRKGLAPVALLRLCGPASLGVPPYCDFPGDLREEISGKYYFLSGGFQYDKTPITEIDEEEVKRVAKDLEKEGDGYCPLV